MSYHILLTDHDHNVVVEGDVAEGEHLTKDSVELYWEGTSGEQRYTFRDPGAWVQGANAYVTWTDDTERNTRKDQKANVVQTVELPLPAGGVVGPFYLVVFDEAPS